MDSKKLNEECCFSCQKAFQGTRYAIKMDENEEAIKRILDVSFSSGLYGDTMNLCISCNAQFKDAKEEFLRLKTIEASFYAKKQKWAFTILQSIVDEDYLGTSLVNHFLNLRAKIYGKWKRAFENRPPLGKSVSPVVGITPTVIPGNVRPLISPVVKSVTSLQLPTGVPSSEKVASTIIINSQNVKTNRKIYVAKDPVTGKVLQLKHYSGARNTPANIQFRKITTCPVSVSVASNNGGLQQSVISPSPPKISKSNEFPAAPAPSVRPIVRTHLPGKISSTAATRKSVPVARPPNPTTALAKAKSPDIADMPRMDKKVVKKVITTRPAATSANQSMSSRSRRIIRKPADSSCLYGNEYEKAVKYSAVRDTKMRAKAMKGLSMSESVGEIEEEDSYPYDTEDNDVEMEGSSLEELDADENQSGDGIDNDSEEMEHDREELNI